MDPRDQDILNRMADCGCTLAVLDAVSVALERARVVGVLDAWAAGGGDWARSWELCTRPGSVWVVLCDGGKTCHHGATPDAARAAAAKAIEKGEV